MYNSGEVYMDAWQENTPFCQADLVLGKALEAKEKYGTRKSRGNNEIFERVYFI